jgi:hypothetical protein
VAAGIGPGGIVAAVIVGAPSATITELNSATDTMDNLK